MATSGTSRGTTIRNWTIGLLIAFLAGLIPMWVVANNRGTETARAKGELKLAVLKNQIAAAALYGKRGEYEKARQSASEFFSELGSRTDGPDELSANQRDGLRKLLDERDQIITLLARSDPAGVERLFNLEYQLMLILPMAGNGPG
jgi:hypothetical protein